MFWNSLKAVFTKKPKNPTEFVEKFIRNSQKSRVQLEILTDNQTVLQVDSLRFSPSWFKLFNIEKDKFRNGFVIFFILDIENIEKSEKYRAVQHSGLKLLELDEMHDDIPVRTFAKFVKETTDAVYLGKQMKTILDVIHQTSESDPQALFNLRYINEF